MNKKLAFLLLLLSFDLAGCSGEREVNWEEEVPLQDGRKIIIERHSIQSGTIFPENISMEKFQSISFVNPDTKEKIRWSIPPGALPFMLDFDGNIPYLVLTAYTVSDYNKWKCPNPPYMIYQYKDHLWTPVEIGQLPTRFERRNLIDMSKEYQRIAHDGLLMVDQLQRWLKQVPKDRRYIQRDKIHPIAHGCYPDTLISQGRESEINVKYKD